MKTAIFQKAVKWRFSSTKSGPLIIIYSCWIEHTRKVRDLEGYLDSLPHLVTEIPRISGVLPVPLCLN